MADEIDTTNKFLVGGHGMDRITMMLPPKAGQIIEAKDALVLAAWIVAIVDTNDQFPAILAAVQNS